MSSNRDKENEPGFRLRGLWVFVSVDEDGDEGVCAFMSPMGWLPMVAGDLARLDVLRPIAADVAKKKGARVVLRHFRGPGEDTEEFLP